MGDGCDAERWLEAKKHNKRSESKLDALLRPGQKLRLYFGEGNINNELIHVRALVDDTEVVIRSWSTKEKSWKYRIESIEYFRMCHDNGNLTEI